MTIIDHRPDLSRSQSSWIALEYGRFLRFLQVFPILRASRLPIQSLIQRVRSVTSLGQSPLPKKQLYSPPVPTLKRQLPGSKRLILHNLVSLVQGQ